MNNIDISIANYKKRKNAGLYKVTTVNEVNQKLVKQTSKASQKLALQKKIKIRELKNTTLPYAKHMKWLAHPYY